MRRHRSKGTVRTLTVLVVMAGLMGLLAPNAAASGSNLSPGCPDILKEGDQGDCVATLQFDLDTINPGYNLQQDKKFGPATRIAVLDFQGRNHLGADGIVGPDTSAAIRKQLQDPAEPPAPLYPECRSLTDQGQISKCETAVWCSQQDLGYENGHCVPMDPGATEGGGKTPLECAQEIAGSLNNEYATKDRILEGAVSESARLAAERLSLGVTTAETMYCLFWDLPQD